MVMVDERGDTPIEPEREGLAEGLEALREAEQAEIDPTPIFRTTEEASVTPITLPVPEPPVADPATNPDPETLEGVEEGSINPIPLPDPPPPEGGEAELEPESTVEALDEGSLPIPLPEPALDDLTGEDLEPDLDV
jgi:hypothetical protein